MNDKKYVFTGYCMARNLPTITPAQAKKLTHLNVAFGTVEDGVISIERSRRSFDYVKKLREYNPNLNILLSTGGGDPAQRLSHGEATRTPEGTEKMVSSTMDIVKEYSLDGVDCDWEFPGAGGDRSERFQHTALMKAYRAALDAYAAERGRKCYLTIAAGCSREYLENVEIDKMVGVLDYINLMCYDFRWNSPQTGHQCNTFKTTLDNNPTSAEWAVERFHEAGFPYEGLVVGAAFYSHRYAGVTGEGNGYGQSYNGGYTYGPNYTEIYLNYENSTTFVKHWDDSAKEPWLFDGETFITYDDPMAMRYKCEYVKEKGLAGIMYWEHSGDRLGHLFNAIYDNLMI